MPRKPCEESKTKQKRGVIEENYKPGFKRRNIPQIEAPPQRSMTGKQVVKCIFFQLANSLYISL